MIGKQVEHITHAISKWPQDAINAVLYERDKVEALTRDLDRERAARIAAQEFIRKHMVSEERRRGDGSYPCWTCGTTDGHISGCELDAVLRRNLDDGCESTD